MAGGAERSEVPRRALRGPGGSGRWTAHALGGDPVTHSVELTQQAERKLANHPTWAAFLRKAIDKLGLDPEPDGLTKFVGPAALGVSGLLLNDVFPWRITYQLAGPDRVIIIAIEIHPGQQIML